MNNKKLVKFALTLFVISFILIQFSLAQTIERVGCCARTTNGNTCQDYSYESDCNAGQFSNGVCANVPDCKLITCATPDGCLFNYPKLSCEANGGSISLLAMPAVCEKGCCGIANRGYGVITKKECQDMTTIELGYELSKMDFIAGLTSEKECDLRFAGSDRGCCYNGAATCLFGTREECLSGNGIFRQGIYCSQIVECEAFANQSRGCGILNGDYNKLCNFDSQGNQEDCYQTCWTQNESCRVDMSSGKSVPRCVSTACTIPTGYSQQQMTEGFGDNPILENVAFTGTILNGHSRCYNFFTSDDKENPITEVAFGKSTGLQNNKIVCMYGDFVSAGLGTDRNTLCVDGQNTSHAYTQTNKWQSCSDCGKGSKITDWTGEFFSAGIIQPAGGEDWGRAASILTLPSTFFGPNRLLENLAKFCTESTCESSGFCVYNKEFVTSLDQNVDSTAKLAGDSNSFLNPTIYRDVGASCSPKYTPGISTSCNLCGQGGDSLFNMCEESECSRLGNCEFESNGGFSQAGIGLMTGLGLAISAKFYYIPTYVFYDCLSYGTGAGACMIEKAPSEVGDLLARPVTTVLNALGGIKGLGQSLITGVGSKIVGEGTSNIGSIFKNLNPFK